MTLARAGRYAAAKALFLEAYAAEPHHLVLYNIAQADLQLGELASAASFLRRFLAEGGAEISPERRAAVESELESIEARQALAPEVDGSPVAPAGTRSPSGSAQSTVQGGATAASASVAAAPLARFGAPNRSRVTLAPLDVHDSTTPGSDKARMWGYLLTTGGFAVLGGSIGLYAWNHERYTTWEAEQAELLTSAEQGVPPGSEPGVNARIRENNARLESVKSFDAVPFLVGGVGIAAMGVGLWTLIDSRAGAELQLSSSPSEVELRAHWTW